MADSTLNLKTSSSGLRLLLVICFLVVFGGFVFWVFQEPEKQTKENVDQAGDSGDEEDSGEIENYTLSEEKYDYMTDEARDFWGGLLDMEIEERSKVYLDKHKMEGLSIRVEIKEISIVGNYMIVNEGEFDLKFAIADSSLCKEYKELAEVWEGNSCEIGNIDILAISNAKINVSLNGEVTDVAVYY